MSAAVCVCVCAVCIYTHCCKTHTHHPSRYLPQMRSDVLCHSRLYIIPSSGTGKNRLTFITLANPSVYFYFLFGSLMAVFFFSILFFLSFSVLVCVYSVHVCPSTSIRGTLLFPIRVNRKGPPKKRRRRGKRYIGSLLNLSLF